MSILVNDESNEILVLRKIILFSYMSTEKQPDHCVYRAVYSQQVLRIVCKRVEVFLGPLWPRSMEFTVEFE